MEYLTKLSIVLISYIPVLGEQRLLKSVSYDEILLGWVIEDNWQIGYSFHLISDLPLAAFFFHEPIMAIT